MNLAYIACQRNNLEVAFDLPDGSRRLLREGCEPVLCTGWPTYSERPFTVWPELKKGMVSAIEAVFGRINFLDNYAPNLPDMTIGQTVKAHYCDNERRLAHQAIKYIQEDL